VVHISAHEAEAFSRWAGGRRPTEAEWEKAAAWDPERVRSRRFPWGDTPPTHDHANLEQRLWQPVAVGSYPRGRSFYGCHQMLGDVWEWTASPYLPYPGFEPFPDAARSPTTFAHQRRVLRGGSWATPAIAIRNTVRRAALPEDRRPFAGFRCVRDAA
jgi:iron(II)-dependent oxidoreductase